MKRNADARSLDRATILSTFPSEFLELTPPEQRLSLTLYRLLAQGEPVGGERLAQESGLEREAVRASLQRWPGVYTDAEGRVIGYWGLALAEMSHSFEIEGRRLHTWCAWDSLFIPALIGKTARVESTCPKTGAMIRLTVSPHGIVHQEPATACLSFVRPESDRIRADVVMNFCHLVNFFQHEEAGKAWTGRRPGTFLLSAPEAFALGKAKNVRQYACVLRAE